MNGTKNRSLQKWVVIGLCKFVICWALQGKVVFLNYDFVNVLL